MPLCNDPVRIIIDHTDEMLIKDSLFDYGVIDDVMCGKKQSIVTFAWWYPIGVGAQLRSRMQAFQLSHICIAGQKVEVKRLGTPKDKPNCIKKRDPYSQTRTNPCSLAAKIKANAKAKMKAKANSLDLLYK